MHPKLMKAINLQLNILRTIEQKAEKNKHLFDFLDEMIKEFPELKLSFRLDHYGDICINSKFRKRSDIDPFLIKYTEFAGKDELPKLTMESSVLTNGFLDDPKFEFFPEEGSDCELIQVGEKYVPGRNVPVYKMKCEHEHEEAEKAILAD